MESSDVEFVEDSEPERVARAGLHFRADSPDEISPPPSPAPPAPPARAVELELEHEHGGRSRFFSNPAAPTSTTTASELAGTAGAAARPIRRREVPWAHLHSPPPLSRKVALPAAAATKTTRTRSPPRDTAHPHPPPSSDNPSPPKKPRKSISITDDSDEDDAPTLTDQDQDQDQRNESGSVRRSSHFHPASELLRANLAASAAAKGKGKARSRQSNELSPESEDEIDELDESEPDGTDVPHLSPRSASQLANASAADNESSASDSGDADDDERDAPTKKMDIARFKYKVQGYRGGPAPLPSVPLQATVGSTSASSSSSRVRKPPTLVAPTGPTLTIPPKDHLRLLHSCPVCSTAWTSNKTPATKETHLRHCATSHDYSSETLLVLTEAQILTLAHKLERERREREAGRTLFELTLGVGEGKGSKDVTVVGVEHLGDGPIDSYNLDRIEKLQSEIDVAKKRTPLEAVHKVAGKIKERRRAADELTARQARVNAKAALPNRDDDERMEEDDPSQLALPTPRPTGLLLRVDSAESRLAVAANANAVLNGLKGTGLTQVPSLTTSSTSTENVNHPLLPSLMEQDEDGPPSTQPFAASKLAERLAAQGTVEVIALPPKNPVPMKEVQPGSGPRSLWRATDGTDDATLRRIVSESPLSLSSSSSSPSSPALRRRSNAPFASSPTPQSPLDPSLTTAMSGLAFNPDEVDRWEDDEWAGGDGVLVWEGAGSGDGDARMDEGLPSSSSDDEPLITTTRTPPARRPSPSPTSDHHSRLKPFDKARRPLPPHSTHSPKPISKLKHKSSSSSSASPGFDLPSDGPPDSDSDSDSGGALPPPPPPPRASTSTLPRPSGMPDYTLLSTSDLQSQVSRYGFRLSKERSVLVDQLTQVWIAMHPPPPPPTSPKKSHAPAKKSRGKKLVPKSSDEDREPEETVGESLRKLILDNEELYLKPIFFDDIVSLAAKNGVKSSKPLLMRCLDEQCITFFTQDPTNGARKRYK